MMKFLYDGTAQLNTGSYIVIEFAKYASHNTILLCRQYDIIHNLMESNLTTLNGRKSFTSLYTKSQCELNFEFSKSTRVKTRKGCVIWPRDR
jgi:hypothetical protein